MSETKNENLSEKIEHAKAIQAKYQDMLLQKSHVVGVSVGMVKLPDSDEEVIGIVVLVDHQTITRESFQSFMPNDVVDDDEDDADRIPDELDGLPVSVQNLGGFFAG